MDQTIDSSDFDQIQTPQCPVIHHPSQEMSEEVFQAKGDLMKSIQTFLGKFNCISFGDKPKSRPTFYNNDEKHFVQYKEYLENSSNAITASNFNQEKEGPPQDSNIYQLVREECGIKVYEEQKKNMEDTLLELLEVCRQKEFYCMHNDVDDLIEKSLQNFRVIHKKSSISLNNLCQISPVNSITPVLPIEEPKYSLSMGYGHLSTTLETESNELNKSSVKNLVPIPREYEVTSENKKKEFDLEDILQIQDVILREKLLSINRLIADIEFLNDNPTSNRVLKSSSSFPIFEKSDNSLSYSNNSSPKFETFSDHMEETRSGSTTTHANNSFPEYDSFCFEIEPDQRRLTSVVMKDISDNLTNDPLLKEVDLFLASDILIPPGIKNFDYDSVGDIYFLKELLINDSIPLLENESSNFYHQNDPSIPRPPLKPPDVEFFFDFEPNSEEVIIEDECFDPGREINVFSDIEDGDYFPFIFVIRIFLQYLINPEFFPLLFSTGSEDIIFDPSISV
nr:hypothetical protein [Tanacetum cinerariifolium]